jgi:hypothetical protein
MAVNDVSLASTTAGSSTSDAFKTKMSTATVMVTLIMTLLFAGVF